MEDQKITNLANSVREEVNVLLTKLKDVPTDDDDNKDLVFLQCLKIALELELEDDRALKDDYREEDYNVSFGLDE